MIRFGRIIFYKNIPEVLSWVQRVVTNTIYSHLSLSLGILPRIGRQTEFDADIKVRLHSFDKRTKNMDVLELIDVPHYIMAEAIEVLIKKYDGKSYGFIQWLTIFIRFAFQWMGFNSKGWKILWGWGTTCSELIYKFLLHVCVIMCAVGTYKQRRDWHGLRDDLLEYNPDTFVPQDVADLAKIHINCLRWV